MVTVFTIIPPKSVSNFVVITFEALAYANLKPVIFAFAKPTDQNFFEMPPLKYFGLIADPIL